MHKVAKCNVTKIKIYEFIGFVEVIQAIKTKNVSLQIVSNVLAQLYSNESILILLKMAWFLKYLYGVQKF